MMIVRADGTVKIQVNVTVIEPMNTGRDELHSIGDARVINDEGRSEHCEVRCRRITGTTGCLDGVVSRVERPGNFALARTRTGTRKPELSIEVDDRRSGPGVVRVKPGDRHGNGLLTHDAGRADGYVVCRCDRHEQSHAEDCDAEPTYRERLCLHNDSSDDCLIPEVGTQTRRQPLCLSTPRDTTSATRLKASSPVYFIDRSPRPADEVAAIPGRWCFSSAARSGLGSGARNHSRNSTPPRRSSRSEGSPPDTDNT